MTADGSTSRAGRGRPGRCRESGRRRRRNGCGVFDPVTRALIVFGGTADGRTSEPGGVALVVGDDEDLRFVELDVGEAVVRSSGFGAALPGGGVACGFGNDATTFRDVILWR